MTLTAGSYSYTLPSQIIRIKEMVVTPVGATVSAPLLQTTLDEILRRRRALGGTQTAGGYTTHYALVGFSDFEIWPTPQSADVITIYYVAAPTALSGNTDVPILPEPFASKVLEYGAAAEAADFKGDPAENEYRQLYQMWTGKLQAHLNRRKGNQPQQFRIFNQDVFPPHDPSTDLRYY